MMSKRSRVVILVAFPPITLLVETSDFFRFVTTFGLSKSEEASSKRDLAILSLCTFSRLTLWLELFLEFLLEFPSFTPERSLFIFISNKLKLQDYMSAYTQDNQTHYGLYIMYPMVYLQTNQ